MTDSPSGNRYESVERKVRLLTILRAAADVGLDPVRVDTIHALAYLTDALSPVWGFPPLDVTVLKRAATPFFPVLQRDLDSLVGQGLVRVVRLDYLESEDGRGWRLDADYVLDVDMSAPAMTAIGSLQEQARRASFVREVVYAASGLGPAGVDDIGSLDATYSSPLVDVGGVIDIGSDPESSNPTAAVTFSFASLAGDGRRLSQAELVHLYLRHLYSRMTGA